MAPQIHLLYFPCISFTGLNMGTNISPSLPGAPSTRTPTLAGLSAAAMKQPQGTPPAAPYSNLSKLIQLIL